MSLSKKIPIPTGKEIKLKSLKIHSQTINLKLMYEKILVAIDNSPASEAVFNSALGIAKAYQSEMMLLHVLAPDAEDSPISFAPMTMSYNPETMDEYQQKWQEFAAKCIDLLKSYREIAAQHGVKTVIQQVNGHPAKTICNFAKEWNANLVVIGRRGHSMVSEILMGSVSSYVLHRVHTSVFIVQS
jgi:nucleotide-binding universal stress UspA family protein